MITPDLLAALCALASEEWRARGPYAEQHVGDLAWGSCPTAGEVSAVVDGDAYAFHDGDAWHLGGARRLLDVVGSGDVWTLASAPPGDGWTPAAAAAFHHLVRDLDDLPDVPYATTTGATDPDARVALHRAAWAPSRFTREVYERVRATAPYDAGLDVVALTERGEWAAYCLAWHDPGSRSGELEPVGAAPAYRRRGYAAAACLAALHGLRERGATTAVVYAIDDPANPGPLALYRSLGFVSVDRHVRWQNAGTFRGGTV